ncbi:MAG: tetratricopeptide repeat protein [candidate division KSB1 bacterium]|nr:tetratricopeptide repeat protein [candidate division KSB1 bacterium]
MKQLVCCLLLFGVFLSGCASSPYTRGRNALEQEDYQKALVELKQAVKENPLNTEAVRDLGIAFYETKSYRNAALILEKALERWPNNGLTRIYLGATYEKLARLDDAIAVYRKYPNVTDSGHRRQLSARLDLAIQAKLRLEARQALARESAIDPQRLPPNSIAVLNFRNLGGNTDFDPLTKGLADMVITDLSQVKSLTVVERSRMQALLEEMGLSQTGLVDEQTAPRIGHLLGAQKILHGSFLDLAGGKFRLDANLIDAISEASESAGEVSGELARFFRLEKNLVFKVIDELGIRLTEAEEKAIFTIPTENLLAFLAYSRGLEARDRSDYQTAAKEFQQAVTLDPNFTLAKTHLEKTQDLQESTSPEYRPIAAAVSDSRQMMRPRQLRLLRSTRASNPGFSFVNRDRLVAPSRAALPGQSNDVRQPLLEGRNDFGLKGNILIVIELP